MAYPQTIDMTVNEANILNWIRNGQGFAVSTGKVTSAGGVVTGFALWNPANSGKTILIYDLEGMDSASQFDLCQFITADPTLTTSLTSSIINNKPGGPPTVATASYANTATTFTGSTYIQLFVPSNIMGQFAPPGGVIPLPPGNGIGLSIGTATNNWCALARWLEV